jgi:hypothetical protein
MRTLYYWRAEFKDKDGMRSVGWYGRVREGKKHRYFGPHASRLLLVDRAYKSYKRENLRLEHKPEWLDIGPPGWDQAKEVAE